LAASARERKEERKWMRKVEGFFLTIGAASIRRGFLLQRNVSEKKWVMLIATPLIRILH